MAGTVIVTDSMITKKFRKLRLAWTADAADASVPNTSFGMRGWLNDVVTNPGDTAPTANYDIVLNDANGLDVMGGSLANRSTSATERALPQPVTGIYGSVFVDGLTMVLTNNLVNSANGIVDIYYERE